MFVDARAWALDILQTGQPQQKLDIRPKEDWLVTL